MNFKKEALYDDIIIGQSKLVNSQVLIPVYKVNFNAYSGVGLGIDGIIEPIALVVFDKSNKVSFYKLSNEKGLLEIVKTIAKKIKKNNYIM